MLSIPPDREGAQVAIPGDAHVYRGDIERLLAKIDSEADLHLGQYRRQYLQRRIATRLRSLGLHSYRQYADHLDREPGEYRRLLNAMTINVTEFFRDPQVYNSIRETVLPEIISRKSALGRRSIRVWSAGCATGEEPYSVALAVAGALGDSERSFLVSVFGTDIDDAALAIAKKGEYPAAGIERIPEELRVRYVQVEGATFRMRPEIASRVRFRRLNLFADEPVGACDLILCRNVFIYFTREEQDRVLAKFHAALAPGGYLVLGRSEKVGTGMTGLFAPVCGIERIYRSTRGAHH